MQSRMTITVASAVLVPSDHLRHQSRAEQHALAFLARYRVLGHRLTVLQREDFFPAVRRRIAVATLNSG